MTVKGYGPHYVTTSSGAAAARAPGLLWGSWKVQEVQTNCREVRGFERTTEIQGSSRGSEFQVVQSCQHKVLEDRPKIRQLF